jgi:hypothetical protein
VIPVVPGRVRQGHPANEKHHQKKGNLPAFPEEHFRSFRAQAYQKWAVDAAAKQSTDSFSDGHSVSAGIGSIEHHNLSATRLY